MSRAVTERDFRLPEFADAKVEDYEFRADGKLVRKDRWEQGFRNIVSALGISTRDFEIPVVNGLVGDLRHTMEILHDQLGIEMPELDGSTEVGTNPFNDIIVALDAKVPVMAKPSYVTETVEVEPVDAETVEAETVEMANHEAYDVGYLKEDKRRKPK